MSDSDYPRPHLKRLGGRQRKPSTVTTICAAIGIILILVAVFFPVYAQSGTMSPKTMCLSHIKQILTGLNTYAAEYDNRFPQAHGWMDQTVSCFDDPQDYDRGGLFHDPQLKDENAFGYAFRRKASGVKIDSIDHPDKFLLLFDSTLMGRNASSEPSTIPRPGRHGDFDNVGYADGHVNSIKVWPAQGAQQI